MRPDLNRSCVRYLTTLPNIWFDWCVVLHNLNTNKNKVSVLVFLYRTFLPLTATHWDQLIFLKEWFQKKAQGLSQNPWILIYPNIYLCLTILFLATTNAGSLPPVPDWAVKRSVTMELGDHHGHHDNADDDIRFVHGIFYASPQLIHLRCWKML